jgi:hypothetical protein
VPGVAREVADVAGVAGDVGQGRAAFAVLARRHEELVEEVDADYAVTLDDRLNHLVGKLAVRRHDGAAVGVRGHHRARAQVEQLPERLLGQVRQVVDDAVGIEMADYLHPLGRERARRARPAGVAGALPRQADDPQAGGEPLRDVVGRAQGVGAFEEEDRG